MYVCFIKRTSTSCQTISNLIRLRLRIIYLTSGWNKFSKAPYFSQKLLAPIGFMFRGLNDYMTHTKTSHTHSYNNLKEEEEFAEENNSIPGKRKGVK